MGGNFVPAGFDFTNEAGKSFRDPAQNKECGFHAVAGKEIQQL